MRPRWRVTSPPAFTSAPALVDESGLARLFYGDEHGAGATPVWSREGSGPNFLFGCHVCGAGDVNGDGYADMMICERQFSDEGPPERGRAMIFHGGPKGPSREPDWEVRGPVPYAHFGFYAAGIGDVDGDGFNDVAIGAPQFTEGKFKHRGMVEVYRGGRHGCEATAAWRVVGGGEDWLMGSLVAAGDLNGDHVPDLVALSPFWGDTTPERGMLLAYLGQPRRK